MGNEEYQETDEVDERVQAVRAKVDEALRNAVYTPSGHGLLAEWVTIVAVIDPFTGDHYIQAFSAEGQLRHHTLGLLSVAEEVL